MNDKELEQKFLSSIGAGIVALLLALLPTVVAMLYMILGITALVMYGALAASTEATEWLKSIKNEDIRSKFADAIRVCQFIKRNPQIYWVSAAITFCILGYLTSVGTVAMIAAIITAICQVIVIACIYTVGYNDSELDKFAKMN